MIPPSLLLLLLLHLLQIDEGDGGRIWRLLSALHQHTPVFRNGQLAVERRRLFASLNVNSHIQLTVGLPAEDAVGRRYIGIIPAHCSANVAVVRY